MNILYTEFLKTHTRCPFCVPIAHDVVKGNNLAFLICSLAPYTPYHMLVVPKRHVLDYVDLTRQERESIDSLVVDAIKALEALGMSDYSVMVRSGDNARIGKSVNHLHFHVIPKVRLGTIDINGDERTVLSDAEMKEVVEKVKAAL